MIAAGEVLQSVAGIFQNGYDGDDINRVFGAIGRQCGIDLICVWDYFDDWGYGGDSQFYLVDGGSAFEVTGQLWCWLHGGRDEAPGGPGNPAQWKGAPADFDLSALGGDGFCNVAPQVGRESRGW